MSEKNIWRDKDIENSRSGRGPTSVVPTNLELFLPHVVQQLNLPFVVVVQQRQQVEYLPKANAGRIAPRRAPQQASRTEQSNSEEKETMAYYDEPPFIVTTVVDATGHVVELCLERCSLPCELLKVLQLTLPYQPALERLWVRRCLLTHQGLAELALLPLRCSLTDVCLDDSPVPSGNYERLLDNDRLRRLSLARCSVDDAAAARLAARLGIGGAASRSLRSLTLTANRIGDAGARALATALRTNRALVHLDLAGNEIGDEGGCALLHVLLAFPLTAEEELDKRRRRMAYVRRVEEAKAQCLARLEEAAARGTAEDARRRRAPVTRPATPERPLEARAAAMALDRVGPDDDVYCPAYTMERHGRTHCRGNWALVYLNLAYNSMSAVSLALLERALTAQVALRQPGLLRVVIDGNDLPVDSAHFAACEALLDQALTARIGKIKRAKPKS